jgi:hypothetical protein
MSVIIQIDPAELLVDLVARLRSAGCWAVPIDSDACCVVHRQAETPKIALTELRFFTEAWAWAHGAGVVSVRPAVPRPVRAESFQPAVMGRSDYHFS